MWSYAHIAKTRNGYELVHSTSRDLSDNLSIINSWSHFETKKAAKKAAKELKTTGSLYGSVPYLGTILFTF